MPKKSKKAAEPELAVPPIDTNLPAEAALDKEAEHRMQQESPALPHDGQAEAEAQTADTFDDAFESKSVAKARKAAVKAAAKVKVGDTAPAEPQAPQDVAEEEESDDDEAKPEIKRPPAKLERLQKILAQAGVASRRHAETLITAGRVQVNGQTVTELGTKADAGRDHIRVDGKLLQGAERLRYFVLNKPKGYVTTVKDPEGRATVMEFFAKMNERLYPVGRLDYQSEGLLLMTNDGELANKLTKAASGVEKTYLVKVSGQPTEDELEILRNGVTIDKGKPGEGRVRTAKARIRQVRQGDNPWYEVVLIEGRNRELRKMFEEIGHFVEKIRRIGYGPLVLDQEPGNLRELEPSELDALRKAADGKYKTPKSKDVRRRNLEDAGRLPTVTPKPSRPAAAQPWSNRTQKPAGAMREEPVRDDRAAAPRSYPARKPFGAGRDRDDRKPFRPARPEGEGFGPAAGRNAPESFGAGKPAGGRFAARSGSAAKYGPAKSGPPKFGQDRPAWKKDDRPARPSARDAEGRDTKSQGSARSSSAGRGRTGGDRSFGAKPAWNKPGSGDRSSYQRPTNTRREAPEPKDDFIDKPAARLHIEAVEPEARSARPSRPSGPPPRVDRANFEGGGSGRSSSARPSYNKPAFDRPRGDRPRGDRPAGAGARSGRPPAGRPSADRPHTDRPRFDKPRSERPSFDKPRGGFDKSRGSFDKPRPGRPSSARPSFDRPRPAGGSARPSGRPSSEGRPPRPGGLARPFTTSSGVPRAGGARPSSKPGGKTGWKPKPSFGKGRPASGGKPRSSSGGPRKPGGKRSGPPGGKRH